MDKYIGEQKVKEYNEIEGKVQYTRGDGSGDMVTREQFDAMLKDEPYDEGMCRVFKWSPAVKEIMAVLLKNDMMLIEKDFVTGRIDATIIENYQKASAKLFGAQNENMIRLSQINRALIGKDTTMSEEEVVATPEVAPETPAASEAPSA